ncbi:DUF1937 family protein [Oleidesulfovibrio alaskensis]|uniref:DUF1937 family protein n=1 Tax=Oleidesulfovibrio alaskensis TaxID=58180 RepID=UPI0009DDA592
MSEQATTEIRLVYLATPYSHASDAVRHARFLAVTEVAARMWRAGLGVYSPIIGRAGVGMAA